MEKCPVGILISGRGSNMATLIRASADPAYPAEIRIVISNDPQALGLRTARDAGIAALAIDHRIFGRDRAAHEREIDAALCAHGVRIVCLAGYMRMLTPFLVERWQGRMLNIHPSLLPELPGLHTHARALQAGHARHGCTVHLVTDTMDAGPILAQHAVPILPGDDEARLAARVLEQEHILYPRTLRRFIEDQHNAPPPLPAALPPP